jgi:hypothetical protein
VGLAVFVFPLAMMRDTDPEGEAFMRRAVENINTALTRRGLTPHQEPEPAMRSPWPSDVLVDMPYGAYRSLGIVVAQGWDGGSARELERGAGTVECRSHLLAHSGTEGFFVPQPFHPPLFAEGDEPELPGGLVGSSYRLAEDLAAIRDRLGIGKPPAGEREATLQAAWRTLDAAARISIDCGTLIWFQ